MPLPGLHHRAIKLGFLWSGFGPEQILKAPPTLLHQYFSMPRMVKSSRKCNIIAAAYIISKENANYQCLITNRPNIQPAILVYNSIVVFCKYSPNYSYPCFHTLFNVILQHLLARCGIYFLILESDLGTCFVQLSVAEKILCLFQVQASRILPFFACFLGTQSSHVKSLHQPSG